VTYLQKIAHQPFENWNTTGDSNFFAVSNTGITELVLNDVSLRQSPNSLSFAYAKDLCSSFRRILLLGLIHVI